MKERQLIIIPDKLTQAGTFIAAKTHRELGEDGKIDISDAEVIYMGDSSKADSLFGMAAIRMALKEKTTLLIVNSEDEVKIV